MRKTKRYLIIVGAIIIGLICVSKVNQYHKFSKAQDMFEEQVLPDIQQAMSCCIPDVEIEVSYENVPTNKWAQRVRLSYSSSRIDKYYTKEWDDDCNEVLIDLIYMRYARDRFCGYYTYDIGGKEIIIDFNDDFTDMFAVHGKEHNFVIRSNSDTELKIDGKTLYKPSVGRIDWKKYNTGNQQHFSNSDSNSNDMDMYDVYEYNDPDDFYDDHYDEFDSFEDAEDYYYEAWE